MSRQFWIMQALVGANLTCSDFSGARLRNADLTGADLVGTFFGRANLEGATLNGITMYNTGTEDWNIKNVQCTHFFVYPEQSAGRQKCELKRVPKEGFLAPGEFEDRFKARPTIEFIFENGMNAIAPAVLDLVIGEVNIKEQEAGLRLLEITVRGGIPRAIIEIAEKVSKEDALRLITACYQQKTGQMQKEIEGLSADKESLLKAFSSQKMLLAAMGQNAYMSVSELAKYFGVETEKLRKRLDRRRAKYLLDAEFFIESQDKGARKPTFLYNSKLVAPIAEDLKNKNVRQTSGEKKKEKN